MFSLRAGTHPALSGETEKHSQPQGWPHGNERSQRGKSGVEFVLQGVTGSSWRVLLNLTERRAAEPNNGARPKGRSIFGVLLLSA